jgi:hypothetical protein
MGEDKGKRIKRDKGKEGNSIREESSPDTTIW